MLRFIKTQSNHQMMNPYLYVFLISMLPFIELRGGIPYGIFSSLNPFLTFLVAIAGNMLPVPFILLFLEDLEKYVRRWEKASKLLDWIFERTYKKADKKVRRWEYFSLILFVAVPLPGTGAWTGSLIAYLFKMNLRLSILMIFVGVMIAGIIVLVLSYYGFLYLLP